MMSCHITCVQFSGLSFLLRLHIHGISGNGQLIHSSLSRILEVNAGKLEFYENSMYTNKKEKLINNDKSK